MKITFAGAADTVTGSRHLVEMGAERILLDCGLFQGYKTLRERNWQPLPPALAGLSAIVLSHAHLDHSGYIPVLCRDGHHRFGGPIFCTPATRDLAEIMLLDSAHILEEEAAFANRHGYSKHAPALPLYTVEDVRRALKQFRPVSWNTPFRIGAVKATFARAGHILGAATTTLVHGRQSLAYSGDLGRPHDLLIPPPARIAKADVLIVESTYGNRHHPPEDAIEALALVVRETVGRGGTVLIPSFTVGRAQELLWIIGGLQREGRIPKLPVFLDSPMATKATSVFKKHAAELRIASSPTEMRALFGCAKNIKTPDESRAIGTLNYPAIIIAGSGMATGGRILHHLKTYGTHSRNHIVFPGFQVPGTRGAKMLAGERAIKIHGQIVDIHAQVSQIGSLSAHADADEILQWLRGFCAAPTHTFVVHGEREASDALRMRIHQELGWQVSAVEHMQEVVI